MRKKKLMVLLPALCVLISGGFRTGASSDDLLPLVPWPAQVERTGGSLVLSLPVTVIVPEDCRHCGAPAKLFINKLSERWGRSIKHESFREKIECPDHSVGTTDGKCVPCRKAVLLGEAVAACGMEDGLLTGVLPDEGHRLTVSGSVLLDAESAAGYQHGLMSLLQLISNDGKRLKVRKVAIRDYPNHEWRGLMLDSSRTFIPPEMIKKYLDHLAELKLNVFHWHLTDDQGWRLESKVYPKLHQDASDLEYLSEDKKKALRDYGWDMSRGYYTQEEVREIVAYARERNIMVVPEIDVPGHSSAMLHAYPDLSCSGEGAPIRTWTSIYPTALCPGKESVYDFLDNLFAEVAGLFPAPYVHIGSDEVVGADWLPYEGNRELMEKYDLQGRKGLQGYFVKRAHKILLKHGKTMIAWDETASYLPEDAVCQVWRDHDYAEVAASKGNRVIVSLFTPHYLNYSPFFHTMKSIYNFRQVPADLSAKQRELIIGGEVCIWGRQPTVEDMETLTFPRLLAFSESVWTEPEKRDWKFFLKRLKPVQSKMESEGTEFGGGWRELFPRK